MKWLNGIWAAFGAGGATAGNPVDSCELLDNGAFRRELHRRRALVDRAGGTFVLLVFQPVDSPAGAVVSTAVLGTLVSKRARVSDVTGYYDESGTRVGVILPETDGDGSRRFIDAVEELLGEKYAHRGDRLIKCSVSHYPEVDGRILVHAEAVLHDEKQTDAGPIAAKSSVRP